MAPVSPREITFEDVAECSRGDIVTPSEGEYWPGGVTVPLSVRELDPAARTMVARTGVTEQNPHGTAEVTVTFGPPAAAPVEAPEEPAS